MNLRVAEHGLDGSVQRGRRATDFPSLPFTAVPRQPWPPHRLRV